MNYEQWLRAFPVESFDPEKERPEMLWLIEDLFLAGGRVNGLFGAPKAGKSRFLGWTLAALLASKDLPGLQVGNKLPERILYVRGEEHDEDIQARIAQYGKILGANISDWGERLFLQPGMGMGLHVPRARRYFHKAIQEFDVDLMVIDPLVRVHGAKENDVFEMGKILTTFREWCDREKLDIVLVHHTGKLDETANVETSISDWARGSSDIAGILDAGVYLHRAKTDIIKLYRLGRYAPKEPLMLNDLGDDETWEVV